MRRHRSKEFSVASDLRERSLSSELSLLDVEDDLVWQRDGRVTLLYRIRPLHEPALTDEDFDLAAMAAENVWSSLPENTSYQFIVLVERRQGLAQLSAVLPPIPGTSGGENTPRSSSQTTAYCKPSRLTAICGN